MIVRGRSAATLLFDLKEDFHENRQDTYPVVGPARRTNRKRPGRGTAGKRRLHRMGQIRRLDHLRR